MGWVRRHIDVIEADEGTVIEILQVQRDGLQSRTEYELTKVGLVKVERTISQDLEHLK